MKKLVASAISPSDQVLLLQQRRPLESTSTMVSKRRFSSKARDSAAAPSLNQHIGGGLLLGSSAADANGKAATPSKLYGKLDDGSLDRSENPPSCLSWREVPTLAPPQPQPQPQPQRPQDNLGSLKALREKYKKGSTADADDDDDGSVQTASAVPPQLPVDDEGRPAGLLDFLNKPKRMLGRFRSSPSICSGTSSVSTEATPSLTYLPNIKNPPFGAPKSTGLTPGGASTKPSLSSLSLLPKVRRSKSSTASNCPTPDDNMPSLVKESLDAIPDMENSFQNSNGSLNNSRHSLNNSRHSLSNSRSSLNHSEYNSQHNASRGSLNNSQSSLNHSHSSLNNSGSNLNNSASNLSDKGDKKKISVVIKPVSRSAAKRRASTTVKPLSRVPKEIVLTELQTPVSPLHNPKFAVPAASAVADAPSERKARRSESSTTAGTKSSSSKRRNRRGSDSEIPQLDIAKLEKRVVTAAVAPDSPSVAGSEHSDVSATRQGRSDPPARIQRSSSKDSTFLMLQHVQSSQRSKTLEVDSDDDDDDNESLWSECLSMSNFTSCGVADADDQSTVSDASILLEHAMTPQSYNDLGPRDSPTRRFSVDNGVLADISRQLYSGDERLSNSFLVELDEDEEEDETYNTSFSSIRGGEGNSSSRSFNNSQKMTSTDSRFTASTSYSSSERNSMSDMQAAFESSLQLSGIDNDDDDEQEDGLNLSSYLPGTGPTVAATATQSDSLSRSCPHLVVPGKAPARINAAVLADGPVAIKRVDSFDGNLPDMHHAPILGSSTSLFPTSALDCSSLSLTAKPKRRPKSALSLDKDASKKKKQGKQKSRSKLEVYE